MYTDEIYCRIRIGRELGVGVTLVVEILSKNILGYGTTLVARMGITGVLLAYVIVYNFNWRISYFIGGNLGLFLMALRIKVFDSGILMNLKNKNIKRENILVLFINKTRLIKYNNSILIGMPI